MSKQDKQLATNKDNHVKPSVGLAEVFGDPSLIKSTEDDPILRYLSNSWRQILTTCLAFAALFYIVNNFVQTRKNSQRASGDLFVQVQNDYGALRSLIDSPQVPTEESAKVEREKQIKDLSSRVEQGLASLGDARAPYPNLARLYRGFMLSLTGDIQTASTTLNTLSEELKDKEGVDRLISELAKISLARMKVDSAADKTAAQAELSQLVSSSEYVGAVAALTSAGVSSSEEEVKRSADLIKQVLEKHPEQAPILENELKKLQ